MNDETPVQSSFDKMVYVYKNHTHCDWRVTLDCENGPMYLKVYQICIISIAIISLACAMLLLYRMKSQKWSIFAPKTPGTGRVRPNPLESFLVWGLLWMMVRLSYLAILCADILPENYLAREFLQEMSETFGATALAWFAVGTYLQIGIHLYSKRRPWRPNSRLADRFLILVTIVSPITVWSVAAASGYFRDVDNVFIADVFVTAHYLLWGFWHIFGILGVFYFGRELCNVLRFHIQVARANNNISAVRVNSMESGLSKIRTTLYIISITYTYCVVYSIVFGVFRVRIITQEPLYNKILFYSNCFSMPVCMSIIVLIVSIRNKQLGQNVGSTDCTKTTEDDADTITSKTHLRRKKSKIVIRPELPGLETFATVAVDSDMKSRASSRRSLSIKETESTVSRTSVELSVTTPEFDQHHVLERVGIPMQEIDPYREHGEQQQHLGISDYLAEQEGQFASDPTWQQQQHQQPLEEDEFKVLVEPKENSSTEERTFESQNEWQATDELSPQPQTEYGFAM